MSDETKKQRKQTARQYAILEFVSDGENTTFALLSANHKDSAAARKALKADGEPGKIYQVACFIGGAVELTVQTAEKRTLEDA